MVKSARKAADTEEGPTTKWLVSLVLLAAGYFLAGRLGQFLAVPPSYATAIWPASGIAVTGVLLAGYRVWPGLFFGALMVNGWTPLSDADSIQAAAGALLVPICISVGATFQAILGALIRRQRSNLQIGRGCADSRQPRRFTSGKQAVTPG